MIASHLLAYFFRKLNHDQVQKAFEIMAETPPKDYLVLAIVAYILCFPFGAVALYYSSETRRHNRRNERALALKTSRKVFSYSVAGIIMACIAAVNIWIVFLIATFKR